MARTLGTLLDEHAAALIGRDRERALLAATVAGEGPPVVLVHGLAGVGKSALLRAGAVDARAAGARVVALDGGAIEPTEQGFLDALSQAAGQPVATIAGAADALDGDTPAVVLVDTAERLRLLDSWLRRTLVPALPANVRVIVGRRDSPEPWRRELGPLVRTVELDRLAPADALDLLRRAGLDDATARAVDRVARGHPLSLGLAAAALSDDRPLPVGEATLRPMMDELTAIYLDGLAAPTRRALEAACLLRRATVSLLGAMLPDVAGDDAFARLRALEFVTLSGDGLVVHDALREVTRARLRAADPVAKHELRRRAWGQLRRELREVPQGQMWRYTADMLYLVETPIVHDAFFPSGSDAFVVEAADSEDGEAIRSIGGSADWWRSARRAFRVARDRSGRVAGYETLLVASDVPHELATRDPVVSAWREHLRAVPVPRGSVVLFNRHSAVDPVGADPRAATAALWLDVKRDYLELRPDLRRIYVGDAAGEGVPPALAVLGFARVQSLPDTLMLDFGPGSIDGWLTDVVGRELREQEDARLDAAGRELLLDGRRVELTRLEAGVLAYLREREDEPVARDALLRDVWGYEWTGGSNVVEVTVSGLRRKLGDRAGVLETVRGVGYRLRPLQ